MLDGEEKLIKEAIRGRASAFGSLYDHYQPKIYRFALIKTGRREEAEDLTHEVFLRAWQNIRSYESMGFPFSSWLYRIARNEIIDRYRSAKNTVSLEKVDPEYFVAPASAPADVGAKMALEKVRLCLAKLKPDYQDVILMRFVEDMPVEEVARAMDRSAGAVKLLQHRAIRELKKMMGGEISLA